MPDLAPPLLRIRPEAPGDAAAIARVTELAFRDHPHSSHTEQHIVAALRRAGALSVSLVAVRDGQVLGHIALSPVTFSDASPGWYGLGPVSVLPPFQRQGIGSRLVQAGLDALRALDAEGCVLLGEPDYYARFGFRHRPDCVLEGVPAHLFQSLTFGARDARGTVTYHPAFDAQA
ncbi:MAG: N-acetyltransferase [Myxococcota bacterium]